MESIYKTRKAADHGTKLFWVRAKRGEQQGNCSGRELKPPGPGKDSYRVNAKDARSQKCRLLSLWFCTSTVINMARTRSMKTVPNSYDRF